MRTRTSLILIVLSCFVLAGARCQEVGGKVDDAGKKVGEFMEDLPPDPKPEDVAIAASAFIPGARGLAEILGAVALFARAWHSRNAGRNIAKAINSASSAGKIDFNETATQGKLSRMMGNSGKRLVDEAQGKRVAWPI